jgi:Zn-dependent metalloprotease
MPGVGAGAAARAHLTALGPQIGISSPGRDLVTRQVLTLKSGGSVVRFGQQVGGVPVFGGQVVLDLDSGNGLTSALSHVSAAKNVPAGTVPRQQAEQAAVGVTAQQEGVDPAALQVTAISRVVFDPSVVDYPLSGPARPAWQAEVDGGAAVRELVLVDAGTGRVILHFNQVDSALNRKVCDNQNQRQANDVPCTSPVRSEGAARTGNLGVDTAYTLLGETAAAFSNIAGIDLTSMIGVDNAGTFELRATANWCYSGKNPPPCPYGNAFWNGTEMYFGQGYEAADDVVAHELTHGVTQHTSDLFYWGQSGAMNESFSDVFGEIVDRRNQQPGEAPDIWLLGEDLPGGAIRSLANPPQFGQPDKMTSSLYTSDPSYNDAGGVHTNSGVGNKTFYLISHGGTFNGITMTGIDGSDPTLAKSALLYYDTLVSLASGSSYADLGRVLQQQCGDLATAGTLGFTTDNCSQVSEAVTATELAKNPPGKSALPAAPSVGCPRGTVEQMLFDGESSTSNFQTGTLWTRAPNASLGVPSNEVSPGGSWFGFDPSLTPGDPRSSALKGSVGVDLPAGQVSYLRFSQWRLYQFDPSTGQTYDGGTVGIDVLGSSGYQRVAVSGNSWVNGPEQTLIATYGPGFGGDSHGWITSRLSLKPEAGKTIRPVFVTHGTTAYGAYGWYLDDIQIYTCRPVVPPGAVATLHRSISGTVTHPSVTLGWTPPADLGEGLTGYQVGRTGWSHPKSLSVDTQSFTFKGLRSTKRYRFWVRPLGVHQALAPQRAYTVKPVAASVSLRLPRARASQLPGLSGSVRIVPSGRRVGPLPFRAEFRYSGTHRWRALHWPVGGPAIVWSTDRRGRYWATYDRPRRTIIIRVVIGPGAHTFGTYSNQVTQRRG